MSSNSWDQQHLNDVVLHNVREWLTSMVVGLNLCPFAKNELVDNRIQFVMTQANTPEQLLQSLVEQLQCLDAAPSIATTVLIHPNVLQDFFDYNDFLGHADALLAQMGWEGVYQLASFHPQYQFAGTQPEDAENFTNRAPYPLLHLLREADVERAIASHPDVSKIPQRNIAHMEEVGADTLQNMLDRCCAS